jgi:transcription antitermination factor NusB
MSDYPEFDPNSADVIHREEIPHELTNDVRSLARRVALQVLYQVDSSHHSIAEVMRYYLVIDRTSGKIADIELEIASLVGGIVRQVPLDSPFIPRIHEFHRVYDQNGTLREGHPEQAQRLSAILKYLEAEPDVVRLTNGVVRYQEQLDAIIQEYAPEFPILQVAIIDRNVLRLAVYELCIDLHTPVSVAIDEAVNLAQLFGAEGSPRFVNGVLGSIAVNLEEVRTLLHIEEGGH